MSAAISLYVASTEPFFAVKINANGCRGIPAATTAFRRRRFIRLRVVARGETFLETTQEYRAGPFSRRATESVTSAPWKRRSGRIFLKSAVVSRSFFDIDLRGEAGASLAAAANECFSAPDRLDTGSKTVCFSALSLLRLVCSLHGQYSSIGTTV